MKYQPLYVCVCVSARTRIVLGIKLPKLIEILLALKWCEMADDFEMYCD